MDLPSHTAFRWPNMWTCPPTLHVGGPTCGPALPHCMQVAQYVDAAVKPVSSLLLTCCEVLGARCSPVGLQLATACLLATLLAEPQRAARLLLMDGTGKHWECWGLAGMLGGLGATLWVEGCRV